MTTPGSGLAGPTSEATTLDACSYNVVYDFVGFEAPLKRQYTHRCLDAQGRDGSSKDILLLGPVEVRLNGEPVALGGPKHRALLALLALRAGATVSADELIDGLWGAEPPATASKLVQQYVSLVRKALASAGGHDLIITHGRGYELRIGREQVDVGRFERLSRPGSAARRARAVARTTARRHRRRAVRRRRGAAA